MIKKATQVVLFFFIASSFMFCSDDELQNLEPDDDASRRRMRPKAIAGEDVVITLPINTVVLDGSNSTATRGAIKSYLWSKVGGPESSTLTNPTAAKTEVKDLIEGVYTFRLTVTNDRDSKGYDDVVVTVNKNPATPSIPPVISGFSPGTGSIGATVTITGTNFSTTLAQNIVKFNGKQSQVTAATATSITTTVPTGATTGTITVTINNQTATSAGIFTIPVIPAAIAAPGELYFEGNMENVTISGGSLNGWSALKSHAYIDGLYFNNSGSSTYAFQQIRKDPVNNTQNVLYAQTIDDDPNTGGTSRAQMTVDLKTRIDVMHTSHRIYLNPDIAYLTNYSSTIRWFTLFEMWNLRDNSQGGDPAGSSRMSLSLFKDTGAGKPLYWHIAHEYMQPNEKIIWQKTSTAAIPFGKWFTMDIYIKRGDAGTGKFKLVITEDGGQPVTVFDITDSNQYPGKPELYINQWQPFKLYTSDQIMDWMRSNNKTISVYYNDYKWYKN